VLERRAAERLKIEAVVDLSVGERSGRVMAYDLSTDGCMLQSDKALLHADARVELTFPNGSSASGRVVWTKHRNAGVQFAEPMPLSAVARIAKDRPRTDRTDKSSAQISVANVRPSARGYGVEQPDATPLSPPGERGSTAATLLLPQQKIASIFQGAASVALIACCGVLLYYS
jgi:hypothetical protein